MSKKKSKTVTARKVERVMVLYGLDDKKRPRAAKFKESEFKLARKAAKAMALEVYEGPTLILAKVGKPIPSGRIYASGSGFVPNVRPALYEALLSALGVKAEIPPPDDRKLNLPVSWDAIIPSHVVLAQADSAEDGWWETTVEGVEGDMLTLKACLFPDVTVIRHRSAVALLFTKEFASQAKKTDAPPGLPTSWKEIATGQLILAPELDPTDGYWEALVEAVDGDALTLRWRDYPVLPQVKRHRRAVALLCPIPPSPGPTN